MAQHGGGGNSYHGALCPCPECHRNYREVDRATDRRAYAREHAPRILASMYAGGLAAEYSPGELRLKAGTEAGLLFDETEGKS